MRASKIADLVHTRDWVAARTPVPQVVARFEQSPLLDSVVVLDEQHRIGLVTRTRLLGHLGSQFGYALFQRKPIELLADGNVLIVEADAPPVGVIAAAMQREMARVYDDIIVIENDDYLGLVSMRYLLAHGKDLLVESLAEVGDLEAENRRLDEINRAQREFVSNMTHELRAPLNTMLGVARLLARDPKMSQTSRQDLSLLLSSGRDLLGIVNDLLDLYKIESNDMKVSREPVDAAELITSCFAPARYLAEGKPIEIVETSHGLPEQLLIDPVLVRRVVTNLISNAVKFTERGVIALRASWDGSSLGVSVADTGIGIRDEDRGRLFQKFTQLEAASSRRYGGTGLGLLIVKTLVELMEGAIEVESRFGVGTTFRVRLPAPDGSMHSGARFQEQEETHARDAHR